MTDAFPQFNEKYGVQLDDGTYQVPAPWQSGLSNVSLLDLTRRQVGLISGRAPMWENSLAF